MPKINWDSIDTVLLDMDGTLIDKRHEDEFWSEVVPAAYAKKNKLTLQEAKDIVYPKFREKQGSVDWSNINYWEKTLGIDMWKLKKASISMAKLHPHTLRFLNFLKKKRKKIYLVTGASPADVKEKLKVTKLEKYFDGVYNQHDIGYAKVDIKFWKKIHAVLKFDPERTMFADDSESVVMAAKAFGIKHIVLKLKYSSSKPPSRRADAVCVQHFDDVL